MVCWVSDAAALHDSLTELVVLMPESLLIIPPPVALYALCPWSLHCPMHAVSLSQCQLLVQLALKVRAESVCHLCACHRAMVVLAPKPVLRPMQTPCLEPTERKEAGIEKRLLP